VALQDGYLIITGPDGTQEADTLQCCHCNAHYVVRPGSGKRRGWCALCAGTTCGKPACVPCIPFERKLDAQEARERSLRSLLG
jgi:hypothetical protein